MLQNQLNKFFVAKVGTKKFNELNLSTCYFIFQPLLHAAFSFVCLRIFDVRDTGGSGKEAFGCQATRTDQSAEQEGVILDRDDDVREERARVRAVQGQNKVINFDL